MTHLLISIINYNGQESTIACLKSLDQQIYKNITIDVVVIDNASDKPFTLDTIHFSNIKCRVIHSNENKGFSGGHNIGIGMGIEQKADYILVMNNDTIADKHLISSLVRSLEDNPSTAMVSPKIYFSKGSEFHHDRYKENELGKVLWFAGGIMDWDNVYGKHKGVDEVDNGQFDTNTQTDFVSGCCMLIRSSVLQKVGYFDEKYFLYYEDTDLSERVKRAGYALQYQPKGILWHSNAESTGGSGSSLQDYFISRNRLRFGFKYASFKTKLALLKESITLMRIGRAWQKRGIRDYYTGVFGKGSFSP